MVEGIHSPAQAIYWLIPGRVLFSIIPLAGLACFLYIVAQRVLRCCKPRPTRVATASPPA